MSMPALRAASSTVLPDGTATARPSMVSCMIPTVAPTVTLNAASRHPRADVGRTLSIDDVGLDLVVKMLDDRADGGGGDLAQPADGRLRHGMGEIGDELEIL